MKDADQARLDDLRQRLVNWLVGSVYPLWACAGIEPATGAFVECVRQDGVAPPVPRRARIHPRQIFAFAYAARFGWRGDVARIVGRGLDYFITHYRREDGLFRALVDADGRALSEEALLYDQAFVLLGFAAASMALDAKPQFEQAALDLRIRIERQLRAADGGFCSRDGVAAPRESNAHMHLLEACHAWAGMSNDPGWSAWSRDLTELALSRFGKPGSGAFGEAFTNSWEPAPSAAGARVEPGHQFEWASLLLHGDRAAWTAPREAALRLFEIGERHGVHEGVAVNALHDDLSIADFGARLWPQTERLKAALVVAAHTGDDRAWSAALAAAESILPYLATKTPGLWFDSRERGGVYCDAPAPASTLYHLVGAIAALDKTVRDLRRRRA